MFKKPRKIVNYTQVAERDVPEALDMGWELYGSPNKGFQALVMYEAYSTMEFHIFYGKNRMDAINAVNNYAGVIIELGDIDYDDIEEDFRMAAWVIPHRKVQ